MPSDNLSKYFEGDRRHEFGTIVAFFASNLVNCLLYSMKTLLKIKKFPNVPCRLAYLSRTFAETHYF